MIIRLVMLVFVAIGFLTLLMWGLPRYAVYSANMSGQAKLAEANNSREVAVREAQAKRDAAAYLAEAEIARAKGVAQANAIIGDSLKGNDAYLRYLWIDKLAEGQHDTIYVPTEAGLPILEAGKRP